MREERGLRSSRRGIALVIVLIVLAVLTLLGTPFAVSMLLRRKQSARNYAVEVLRTTCRNLRDRCAAYLVKTHWDREAKLFDSQYPPSKRPMPTAYSSQLVGERRRGADSLTASRVRPQDFDSPSELHPKEESTEEVLAGGLRISAQAQVSDEQGKVNVNRSSFLLLANLFGSSHLKEKAEAEDTELVVYEPESFPTDGNPETRDGLLCIYDYRSGVYEAVSYRHIEGDRLLGVERGLLLTLPQAHPKNSLIFDCRALKVFLHRFFGKAQSKEPFTSLSALRQINSWPLLRFFALQLWHYGLSVKDLPRDPLLFKLLGSSAEKGVDSAILSEVERKLINLGLEPEVLQKAELLLGEQAVCDLLEETKQRPAKEVFSELKEELEKASENSPSPSLLSRGISVLPSILRSEGLEALTSIELKRIEDLLTVNSQPDSAFSPEVRVSGRPYLSTHAIGFSDPSYFGAGVWVRFRLASGGRASSSTEAQAPKRAWFSLLTGPYPKVLGPFAGRRIDGCLAWRLDSQLNEALSRGLVLASSLQPAPININSAPYSVIVATLKGVRLNEVRFRGRTSLRSYPILGSQAKAIADMIWQEIPIQSLEHYDEILRNAVQRGIIRPEQRSALLINAINPTSQLLANRTTGFTFASKDTYTMNALAVASRGPVRRVAALSVSEVFHVAPKGILSFVWDTEADFTSHASVGFPPQEGSEGKERFSFIYSVPFPDRFSNLTSVYTLSGLWRRYLPISPFCFPRYTPGVLTSAVSSSTDLPGSKVVHFPETKEGIFLRAGHTFRVRMAGKFPYSVDFFFCPLWESPPSEVPLVTVTDGTLLYPGSTVTLTYRAATAELILKVLGGVKPDPARWSDPEEVFVGIRAPLNKVLAPDTWYHIAFVVENPEPGGQALFLDGRPVGKPTLAANLQALGKGVGPSGFSVTDEDLELFPKRGPFWVGDEIVNVFSRSGKTFQIGATTPYDGESGRGCRGTYISSHRGSLVRPVGYRVPIMPSFVGLDRAMFFRMQPFFDWITDPRTFAIPAVPRRTERLPLSLKRGGARLSESLSAAKRVIASMPRKLSLQPPPPFLPSTEKEFLRRAAQNLSPVPYTYPLIIVICGYPGGPQQPRDSEQKSQEEAPPKPEKSFYPVGPQYNYLPVPVDPQEVGFARRGILRVRYRFEGRDERGRQRSAEYDRIVEYEKIGSGEVPGDGTYPAFIGLRDISSGGFVYRGERRVPVKELLSETLPLRQLRVYGISVPTNSPNLASLYPPTGVIQIANSGRSSAAYPQLRDVEWIRYGYIYRNYFISCVENRIREDDWKSDPAFMPRNNNNTVLRGFCGAITPARGGWAENFDPRAIANHVAGAEIKPVFWVASALPGAGDMVLLSSRETCEGGQWLRIHKKAETDQGVFISFREELARNWEERENPVIRMFPEPAFSGEKQQGGRAGSPSSFELIFGPTEFNEGGELKALIDEVRICKTSFFFISGRPTAVKLLNGGAFLPERKTGERLSVFALPFLDKLRASSFRVLKHKELEFLACLGEEALHLRKPEGEESQIIALRLAKDFGPLSQGPGGNPGESGYSPVVFVPPWRLRERQQTVQVVGNIPREIRSGGYIAVNGFGGIEIWEFESVSGRFLLGVRKGVLGTPCAVSAPLPGNSLRAWVLPARNFEVIRGGLLDSPGRPREPSHNSLVAVPFLEVSQGSLGGMEVVGARWHAHSGYFRVDDGDPSTLDRVVAFVAGKKLILDELTRRPVPNLLGAFGTSNGQTRAGSLICLPFRYYDRYVCGGYSRYAQHFTRTLRVPGALWRRISWEHAPRLPGYEQRVGPEPRIHVLVRFDEEGDWTMVPTNKPGGIYLFSDPVPPQGFPLNREADQIEIRILFYWPEGSYGGSPQTGFSDTWKVAPRLRSLTVEYQDRFGSLERKEVLK